MKLKHQKKKNNNLNILKIFKTPKIKGVNIFYSNKRKNNILLEI